MQKRFHQFFQAAIVALVALHLTASAQAADPSGKWTWSVTTQNGETRETTLTLKADGEKLTGSVSGRQGNETPITNGKIKGDEISFQVERERNGNTFVTKYSGKLSGDTIKGKSESERNGEARSREWEAKRVGGGGASVAKASVAGKWKYSITTQNGETRESTITLKEEGGKVTGTTTGRGGNEMPIEDVKVNGNEVAFQIVRERDGNRFVSKFNGKVEGDTLKGKMTFTTQNGEERSREIEAKRSKE